MIAQLNKKIDGMDKRIKQLRESRGYTQQELADKLETARSVISTYEQGIRMPSYSKLLKLAEIFDVSTDYLLGVDPEATLDLSCLNDDQRNSVKTLVNAMK